MSTWIQSRVSEPSTWAGAGIVCIGVGCVMTLSWLCVAGIVLGGMSVVMHDHA
jgi:hypothetical protein